MPPSETEAACDGPPKQDKDKALKSEATSNKPAKQDEDKPLTPEATRDEPGEQDEDKAVESEAGCSEPDEPDEPEEDKPLKSEVSSRLKRQQSKIRSANRDLSKLACEKQSLSGIEISRSGNTTYYEWKENGSRHRSRTAPRCYHVESVRVAKLAWDIKGKVCDKAQAQFEIAKIEENQAQEAFEEAFKALVEYDRSKPEEREKRKKGEKREKKREKKRSR